jgi:hypothetical protein
MDYKTIYGEFERDRSWDSCDLRDILTRNMGHLEFQIWGKLQCPVPEKTQNNQEAYQK